MYKSNRNKIFLEFLGDYNGVCLKNFQRIEQNLENAFLAKFPILLRYLYFKKNDNWNFNSSIDAPDASATVDIICRRKSFQKLLENLS